MHRRAFGGNALLSSRSFGVGARNGTTQGAGLVDVSSASFASLAIR